MFGRKKSDGEQPEPKKLVAVDGVLSEREWGPLTRKTVEKVEVVRVLDEMPVELRQAMLDVAAEDAAKEDSRQQNAAEFFTGYLSGDAERAEKACKNGILESLEGGFKLGGGKVEARKVTGAAAREMLNLLDEIGDDEEKAADHYRRARAGEQGEKFAEAWASFSEQTGVDVKLVRLNATDEHDDRFKFVIEIPERAGMMLHHGAEMGVATASERYDLGVLRPGVTPDDVMAAARKLGVPPDGLRAAVMAVNLVFGRMAMKGAEFVVESAADEESIEVAIETTDAVWKEALDEANAPVETPHDMAKYIKWLQGEKQRLENELATVRGGGEETS